MGNKVFIAIDLGAGSGRVIAASFDGKEIEMSEISRWSSDPIKVGNSFHWDINAIFYEIVSALRKAKSLYKGDIVSLGIDSWAVDYGLLDENDKLLNLPYIYRDSRTDGLMEEVGERVGKEFIYSRTGIQFLFFNTIYQMAAEVKSANISKAKSFLMIPDLLAFMLTGVKTNERTNASSTQFYNPFKRDWEFDILEKIGVSKELFSNPFVECGHQIGFLKKELADEFGQLPVIAVASHDTASAVVSTPTCDSVPAYINSGTWSLPGIEIDSPIATPQAFSENFTNEVGADNTIRFLKNVTGMWLVQKCKESWKKNNCDMTYKELEAAAAKTEPMRTVFDTDAPDFIMPVDMPSAIVSYCNQRNIPAPRNHGEFFRAIQESIATKYAYVFNVIEKLSGKTVESINIMGGGSNDNFLNQLTADFTKRTVYAGPVESTALGNVIMQMKAAGIISNLKEGRRIIAEGGVKQLGGVKLPLIRRFDFVSQWSHT